MSRGLRLSDLDRVAMSGSTKESSPTLIQPTVALSLAFDHVPLDQRQVCGMELRLEQARGAVCFPFL